MLGPGHDRQQVLVDAPFTTVMRDLVCVCLDCALGGSSATFLTDVPNNLEFSLLAGPIFAHVNNIARSVAMTPIPQGFDVCTRCSPWVARGFLYINQESATTARTMATVMAVQ
jgi:hypothetical protein